MTTGLVQRCLGPIPGVAGSGEDPRYDPRAEALRAEVGKLDSPSGGAVEWRKVEALASDVLATLAKDLFAGTCLAAATLRNRGLAGLCEGLDVVLGLFDTYAEDMHPKRARARGNALAWLAHQLAIGLEEHPLVDGEQPLVGEVTSRLERLQATGSARLGDDFPPLAPVREALARVASGATGHAPAVAPAEATTPAPAAAEPASAEPVSPSAEGTPAAAPEVPAAPAPPAGARELAAPFLEPISADSPAGADAKYDPGYEWVRREIERLDAAAAGELDWKRIAAECDRLLRTSTKDLVLACYYVVARLETDGLAVLPAALAVPSAFCAAYWDTMQPPADRPRRRSNVLTWLFEQLNRRLPTWPVTHEDRAAVDSLVVVARELGDVCRRSFESDGPPVRMLLETIERLAISVPEPPKAEAPPPPPAAEVAAPAAPAPSAPEPAPAAPSAPAAAAAAAMPSGGESLAGLDEVVPFLVRVGTSLVEASRTIRAAAPEDPRGYRLLRAGLYLHIEAPPPHGPDGKTSIPGPPAPLFDRIRAMATHAKWAELLDETEGALAQYRFSLDLHRYSAAALAGLGRADARKALVAEVRRLLERFPELVELSFATGQPLADDATKRFVTDEILPKASGGGMAAAAEADPAAKEPLESLEAAMRDGKIPEAMGSLESLARLARSGEERFRYRLLAASIAAGRGEHAVAIALHAGLDDDVREHRLEAWAPALVAEHLAQYLGCIRSAGNAVPAAVEPATLISRLARIAPSRIGRWA